MWAVGQESAQAYVKQGLSTEGMQGSRLYSLKMRPNVTTIIVILYWCYNPVWVSASSMVS
jgi:hypothetical protein